MQCIDNLKGNNTLIYLYQISAYIDIKKKKKVDVIAKKTTRQKRAKTKNKKQKNWDFKYIAKKQVLKKTKTTIKLILEQRIL